MLSACKPLISASKAIKVEFDQLRVKGRQDQCDNKDTDGFYVAYLN